MDEFKFFEVSNNEEIDVEFSDLCFKAKNKCLESDLG
jgi:hypothetical protein